MKPLILLDSGHGGMINGIYQTAPAKMFVHSDATTAYEGVLNRNIKQHVIDLFKKEGIKYADVCPSEMDIPLSVRCNVINNYCNNYNKDNCLLISLHSNAGGGRGFEIWTTDGTTQSDVYATKFYNLFKQSFPSIICRQDLTDGDPDKESKFYILANSNCPAILPEWLFFDNLEDWKYQRVPINQMSYAKMIFNFVNTL